MRCKKVWSCFYAVCFLSVLCFSNANANDGRITGVGGRWQFLKDEKTSVRMVREWIKMRVRANEYKVEATFIFHNDGQATRVEMGFPETGGGVDINEKYFKKHSGFHSFSSWVDGRRVRVKRVKVQTTSEDYTAFWKKVVDFRAGQTRCVRVEYSGEPGGDSSGFSWVEYDFTGGNWKGKVESSEIEVSFEDDAVGAWLIKDTTGLKQSGTRLSRRWTNWQAEHSFRLWMRTTVPNWLSLQIANIANPSKRDQTIQNPSNARRFWRKMERGGTVNFLPDAFVRPGRMFVSLNHLCEILQAKKRNARLEWSAKTRLHTLAVGAQRFDFRSGSKAMRLNDRVLSLPAPTIGLRRYWSDSTSLYVPAAPILKSLRAFAVVNAKHQYEIQFAKAAL